MDPINSTISFNNRGKYQIVLDKNNGTTRRGPLILDSYVLNIKNVSGLQDALNNVIPIIPQAFIAGSQIQLFTVQGANFALKTIDAFNIKDHTITGANIAPASITGDCLAMDISFNSSNNITLTGTGRFTGNYGDFKYLNVKTQALITTVCAGAVQIVDSNNFENYPLLHINIPFLPLNNNSTVINNVSFFVPNGSVLAYPLPRYRHPFNYYIHGISVLYNTPTNTPTMSNTATINIYTYDKNGNGQKTLLGTAFIAANLNISCDYFTFTRPLFVPKEMSIGGDHKFNIAADKLVSYVLWGFQS